MTKTIAEALNKSTRTQNIGENMTENKLQETSETSIHPIGTVGITENPKKLLDFLHCASLPYRNKIVFPDFNLNFDADKIWHSSKSTTSSISSFGYITRNGFCKDTWGLGKIRISGLLLEHLYLFRHHPEITLWAELNTNIVNLEVKNIGRMAFEFETKDILIEEEKFPKLDEKDLPIGLDYNFGVRIKAKNIKIVYKIGQNLNSKKYMMTLSSKGIFAHFKYLDNPIYGTTSLELEPRSSITQTPEQEIKRIIESNLEAIQSFNGMLELRISEHENAPLYIFKKISTEKGGTSISGVQIELNHDKLNLWCPWHTMGLHKTN